MRFLLSGVAILATVLLASCGDSESQAACTPGESVACTGPAGCSGFQVCSTDGSSFGTCDCGGATTAATGSTTTTSSGAGGDMTTTSAATTGTSSGGGGGGGGMPFSPTDLEGLALWLHTGAGIVYDPQTPGAILRWDDQSGNGHQAVATMQVGWQPIIDPVAVNGHDGVRCLGNGYTFTINDDPSLQWGTGGFLIAGVIRPAPSPSEFNKTRVWNKVDLNSYFEISQPTNDTLKMDIGTSSVATAFPAVTPQYQLVMARGMDLELRVGDSLSTAPTATQNIDAPGTWVLFCNGGNSEIRVAEIIAVKGEVSDTVAEQVRTYLLDKYAL
ncbi:MAG: hypothetical protein HOV80_29905 [Polyangiaceae bacterium]|nr:hypothetical protein [Polyangiaceae bacterium]